MPANVTMTVYLGSSDQGVNNEKIILEAASKKGMNKSEFALFCIYEQIKRENGKEIVLKP